MRDETRELLELAAKAAGHEIVEWFTYDDGVAADILCEWGKDLWEPHESLSDALRLAVDLEITVLPGDDRCTTIVNNEVEMEAYSAHPDKYRATCTAITRAAAEIGRRMQ